MPEESKLPTHIAIIMDGNGRWAQQRGLPRTEGHRAGGESARTIVAECIKLKIPCLTLYAFSTENWSRPPGEVSFLMKMLKRFIASEMDLITQHNAQIRAIGDIKRLPPEVIEEIRKAEELGKGNTGLRVSVGLNYGGRADIVNAAKAFAGDCVDGKRAPEDLDEEGFAGYLSTAGVPDPDLLIRTGGDMRVSNFLLWEISYAEICVTPTLWPDFRAPEFRQVLEDFANRERRFGGLRQPQ